MALAKRIAAIRTLTIIHMTLTGGVALLLGGFLAAFGVTTFSEHVDPSLPAELIVVVSVVVFVLVFAIALFLPWIVLHAIKVRKKNWAIAAIVSLILQVALGAGIFTIFSIISLVLLLNDEASAYIGLK